MPINRSLRQISLNNPGIAAKIATQNDAPKYLPQSNTANLLNNAMANYQYHLKARNAHKR